MRGCIGDALVKYCHLDDKHESMSPEDKPLSCPQCGRRYAEPADRCTVDGSPLYGPEVLARIGSRLNNYQLHSLIGEGGMGVVYKGEHVMLGKPVAIKILHDRFARREGATDQFLREARAASRVRHPNIVDVTDFGEIADGSIYFVMEYLEGESLEDVLGRDHHLELFNAVNVVRQTAHALAAAHDHGIVHLDLKPENIYLTNREGRRRIVRRVDDRVSGQSSAPGEPEFVVEREDRFDFVKLLDFGVAKFTHENLGPGLGTRAGMVFGTPHYMSPEQARGEKVDGRSDVYSLGVLFYEMILGEVPFEGEVALDVLNAHVSETPIPPAERNPQIKVDAGTNRTILKCLEKKPKNRFQSMDALVEALLDCFTDRVFLRDAHKLPGAMESGVVEPPTSQPAPDPRPAAPTPETTTGGGRRTSLTDELAELFSAKDDAEVVEPAPAAFGDKDHVKVQQQPVLPQRSPEARLTGPKPQQTRKPAAEAPRGNSPPAPFKPGHTGPKTAQPAAQRKPTGKPATGKPAPRKAATADKRASGKPAASKRAPGKPAAGKPAGKGASGKPASGKTKSSGKPISGKQSTGPRARPTPPVRAVTTGGADAQDVPARSKTNQGLPIIKLPPRSETNPGLGEESAEGQEASKRKRRSTAPLTSKPRK